MIIELKDKSEDDKILELSSIKVNNRKINKNIVKNIIKYVF